MKEEFICTMYWDENNEADKDLFQNYSAISLLIGGQRSGCCTENLKFEKGKNYKITIEECANASTNYD